MHMPPMTRSSVPDQRPGTTHFSVTGSRQIGQRSATPSNACCRSAQALHMHRCRQGSSRVCDRLSTQMLHLCAPNLTSGYIKALHGPNSASRIPHLQSKPDLPRGLGAPLGGDLGVGRLPVIPPRPIRGNRPRHPTHPALRLLHRGLLGKTQRSCSFA